VTSTVEADNGEVRLDGERHMKSVLSPVLTVICYVIGTVCVLCFAAYWYYTIREDPDPVPLYTLYEYWPWFVLGLVGLVSVGIPPGLWFYSAIRSRRS